MATKVIAAGRREGRQANDWRTLNEKRINQAKTGLFVPNLCETEHPGDYELVEFLSLNPEEILGRLYEMAPVRIGLQLGFSNNERSVFPRWRTLVFCAQISSSTRRSR